MQWFIQFREKEEETRPFWKQNSGSTGAYGKSIEGLGFSVLSLIVWVECDNWTVLFWVDHVFKETTNNASVYEVVGRPIVDAFLQGYNGKQTQ